MSKVIESLERAQLRGDIPKFKAGDTVRVHFKVIEGQRQRIQVFEGIVLKRQGAGARETFTVRKQSFGVGVERTFPMHSPKIDKIEVTAIGDVNRAKLYYLRGKVGKRARVRAKRGVPLPVVEVAPPPTEAAEEAEPEAPDEVVAEEPQVEEAQGEEPQAEEEQAEEPQADAQPAEAEAEPVAEQ